MILTNIDRALVEIETSFFPFPAAADAQEKIVSLIETGSRRSSAKISFLLGPTRSGKTWIVEDIVGREEYRPYKTDSADIMPIVSLLSPDSTSRKALATALLGALNHPEPNGKSDGTADIVAKAADYLVKRGVRLVVIDEVQQLTRTDAYAAGEFFKTLVNLTKVPFLLCGLPDAGDMIDNEQVLNRMEDLIELHPFNWDDLESQEEFSRYVASFDELLEECGVLRDGFSFLDEAVIARMYWLSGGLAGVVGNCIRRCLTIARRRKESSITLRTLAEAAEDRKKLLGKNTFTVNALPDELPMAKFDAGINRAKRRSIARRT